jgi:trk system potassium uptake protein TrkH
MALRPRAADLRWIPAGFLAVIVIGAVLLWFPVSHREGKTITFIDAAFLSISATCVTGLSPVNAAETFNFFGQLVLLVLIQTGGLGIFTASVLLALFSGQKLSLADEHNIRATVGKLRRVRPLDIFVYGCLFIFIFELSGAIALFTRTVDIESIDSEWTVLWEAVFHSVSAFCNAGISIHPEGMAKWGRTPSLLAIIDGLVIAGGIGLMTMINLRYYYFWRRDRRLRGYLTLQTRLALAMTVILLLAGMLFSFVFENGATLKDASFGERISWSFFHSTMARTAGFNVVDVSSMSEPTLLMTALLMFIGGSPGSMAGGIKTVTFAVLLASAWSAFRRRVDVKILGRRIPPQVAGVAIMLTLAAAAIVFAGIGLLMMTEQNLPSSQTPHRWFGLAFEVVSAFGTVGLSAGITPLLSPYGKIVIMLLMFIGRVAPLVLSLYLARPAQGDRIRPPVEEVSLG